MSVYVPGTFDLFHPGHVNLLRQAKNTYGHVVVGLNRDAFIARFKGHPPVMTLPERYQVVEACRFVDRVIVNDGDENSTAAILESGADTILYANDGTYTEETYLEQLGISRGFLLGASIGVVFLPYTRGVSTSELVERCRASGS